MKVTIRKHRGIPSYLADGSKPNVLTRIINGENPGTYFAPQNALSIIIDTGPRELPNKTVEALRQAIKTILEGA